MCLHASRMECLIQASGTKARRSGLARLEAHLNTLHSSRKLFGHASCCAATEMTLSRRSIFLKASWRCNHHGPQLVLFDRFHLELWIKHPTIHTAYKFQSREELYTRRLLPLLRPSMQASELATGSEKGGFESHDQLRTAGWQGTREVNIAYGSPMES